MPPPASLTNAALSSPAATKASASCPSALHVLLLDFGGHLEYDPLLCHIVDRCGKPLTDCRVALRLHAGVKMLQGRADRRSRHKRRRLQI